MSRIPLFPERYGFAVPVHCTEQEPLPRELRNALWNAYCKYTGAGNPGPGSPYNGFCAVIWTEFMHMPIDEFQLNTWQQVQKFSKETFYSQDWMQVFAIIEFTFIHFNPIIYKKADLQKAINEHLSDYSSAFRLVGDRFAPISDEEQLREVELALDIPLKPVKEHLKNALQSLRDPSSTASLDSTRESIHAVESLCQILTGQPNDSLGPALNKLKGKITIRLPSLIAENLPNSGYSSRLGRSRVWLRSMEPLQNIVNHSGVVFQKPLAIPRSNMHFLVTLQLPIQVG
jgi:hypothetical protein